MKIDPSKIPLSLKKTLVAGYSPPEKHLVPACFCVRNEVCNFHAEIQPNIDVMLDLIEDQMETLLKDEVAIDENLNMISKTSEILSTSRKDTFKEQLMAEYRNRQDEVNSLENKINHMSLQEH